MDFCTLVDHNTKLIGLKEVFSGIYCTYVTLAGQLKPVTEQVGIVDKLEVFLSQQSVDKVYCAEPGVEPPPLAYITAFPRLSLVLDGVHPMTLSRSHRAKEIELRKGQALFVPSNVWNKPAWTGGGEVLTFLFGKKQLGISLTAHTGSGTEPRAMDKLSLSRPLDKLTSNLIEALTALPLASDREKLNCSVVESLLHAILLYIEQGEQKTLHKAQGTFESICLYIQENAHNLLTREMVAEHFELSPSHVSRLFRSEGSMRFSEYVNLVRINRAKVILTGGRATVKEVAAGCGYTDAAYFCRVFHRFTRMTPTEYRLSKRGHH